MCVLSDVLGETRADAEEVAQGVVFILQSVGDDRADGARRI